MSAARRPTAASRLGWIDLAQLGIGALAAVSVFLPWYGTEAGNQRVAVTGQGLPETRIAFIEHPRLPGRRPRLSKPLVEGAPLRGR
jgi:hypothetical protein